MKALLRSASLIFIALLPAVALPLRAAEPPRTLAQYQSQNWQWEQGLPSNAIHALAEDTDGRLLIGTVKGLVKFDGSRFTPVAVDPADVSSSYAVVSLLVARDGRLWIGTSHDGLVVRKGMQSHIYSQANGLPADSIQSLYEDDAGAIWVGTPSGTCRILADRVQCLSSIAVPAARMWNNIVDDNEGGVLIASNSGLLSWKAGLLQRVPCDSTPQILTLFRDRAKRLWAGTTNGFFPLRLAAGKATLGASIGVEGPIVAAAEDKSGVLWLSSYGHGLYRWNGRTAENSVEPERFIRSLFADHEGNLWIGGWAEGLTRWTAGSFTPYGVEEGIPNPFAVSVHQDARGAIWLAAIDGGLFQFINGEISRKGVPKPLLHLNIRAMASGPDGAVWFGTAHQGLFRYDGRSLRHYGGRGSPVQKDIRAIVADSRGDLWLGFSPGGVARFQGSVIDAAHMQSFLPSHRLHALLESQPGVILAGSDRGLSQISGDLAMTVATGSVLSLSKDSGGSIWVGPQAGGIALFDHGHLRHFSTADGLLPATVISVLDDGRGSLWMASDRGVIRVLRDQALAVAAGQRSFLETAVYGKLDGMRTTECRWEAQPAGWRTTNGDLWFATANGFVRRSALPDSGQTTLSPQIDAVEIDGQPDRGHGPIQLAPGARQINLNFGAIRLSDPQQLQFRYKLAGFDRDWRPQTADRTARYAALSPGSYTFLLQARSDLGPWSTQTATLVLQQRPYIYQTWWMRCAALILIGVALWFWSRWYKSRLHGKLAAVAEERNRISREWHDSLMAGFAAIAWQLEATRDRLGCAPDEATALLDVAHDMVRHTQTEARRIIWDLRFNLSEDGTLSQTLNDICHRLSGTTSIRVATEFQGEEIRLPGVLSHNLLRIAQESLHNAIHHAQPNCIVVKLNYSTNLVTLRVKDDGCGFVHEQSRQVDEGHLGILGMTERARKLGGSLEVHSTPGTGTEVIASFRVEGTAV